MTFFFFLFIISGSTTKEKVTFFFGSIMRQRLASLKQSLSYQHAFSQALMFTVCVLALMAARKESTQQDPTPQTPASISASFKPKEQVLEIK